MADVKYTWETYTVEDPLYKYELRVWREEGNDRVLLNRYGRAADRFADYSAWANSVLGAERKAKKIIKLNQKLPPLNEVVATGEFNPAEKKTLKQWLFE